MEQKKYDFYNKVSIICSITEIILGTKFFRNEHDWYTIEESLLKVERITGKKIMILVRLGGKEVYGAQILTQDVPNKKDSCHIHLSYIQLSMYTYELYYE